MAVGFPSAIENEFERRSYPQLFISRPPIPPLYRRIQRCRYRATDRAPYKEATLLSRAS
uniref:Uncharacterized protein n=1 Tax=Cucumis melo TaxID=3656 RepID=A0A9I9DNH2_CUCME